MITEHAEKWAEICFLLSESIHQNMAEKDFESQVVRAVEVLGWREFRNEIERQPTIQLGCEGTLRPDLIIRGNDSRCLIVLEVKRPVENITRDYVIGQLRSYMRQMKSDFGFLIGTDLRVYYDGSLNPHSDPILLEKIDFDKKSNTGTAFVETFSKSSLLENRHLEYLINKLQQFNRTREVKTLIEQLTSYETKQKITGYLRNEYPDTDDETFSEALEQIEIVISKKQDKPQQVGTTVRDLRVLKKRIITARPQEKERPILESVPSEMASHESRIATIPFDSHLEKRLRHIYGVLYFMKQGLDFPSATHQTLKLFPEVRDYQTISDKCARGFAGNVDTFISWFQSGKMLDRLVGKFGLSNHDAEIFRKLLT